MSDIYSLSDVRETAKLGSQSEAATAFGVPQPYLCKLEKSEDLAGNVKTLRRMFAEIGAEVQVTVKFPSKRGGRSSFRIA